MLSEQSRDSIGKIVTIGNACLVLPYKWDHELVIWVKRRSWAHKLFPYIFSLLSISSDIYTWYDYTPKSDADYIFSQLCVNGARIMFTIFLWIQWKREQAITFFNALFAFNEQHRKFLRVKYSPFNILRWVGC